MKILYSWNLYREHGGENHWYPSEPALMRSHGHETRLYERDNRELDHFSNVQKAKLFFDASWSQRTYDEVLALCRKEKPDIAHVYNTVVLLSPSIFHAFKDAGVPVVQTLYNYRLVCPAATLLRDGRVCEECIDHSLLRSIQHRCYRGSLVQSAALARSIAVHRRMGTWKNAVTGFIVPTRFMKEKLTQGGIPAEKIHVKPNWHDPDPGARTEAPAKDAVCLYVGRLCEEKGIRTVLSAWEGNPTLPKLRIIGDGPLREETEKRIARIPNGEYLGRKPHEEVLDQMRAALCFLLSSEWYEAFPHTILEAYGCGVPIVASNIGTMPDVIEHGKTGLLYASGDPAALRQAVQDIAGDPAYAVRLGQEARKQFVEKYSVEPAYRNLLAVYERIRAPR